MATLKLLAISGSARNGSLNGRLLAAAAQAAASRGAQVETIDLRSLALPLYDGDLEKGAGVPEGAKRLRDALQAADGVLLATPEYNGFPTPLLVNSFDWLSRLQADGAAPAGLAVTAGKPRQPGQRFAGAARRAALAEFHAPVPVDGHRHDAGAAAVRTGKGQRGLRRGWCVEGPEAPGRSRRGGGRAGACRRGAEVAILITKAC